MYAPILPVDDSLGSRSSCCDMPNITQIKGITFVNTVPGPSRAPTTWQFTG